MSKLGNAQRDARDLDRGLVVNLSGYLLKLAQPALLIWVVRSYGVEAWGQYTVSETLLLVSMRVILVGADKTLLWWGPRMETERDALAGLRGIFLGASALALLAGLAIVALLAEPLAAWRGAPDAAAALRIMAWSLVPMTLMEIGIAAALGKRDVSSHVLIRDGLVSLSFVALALVFFHAGFSDIGLSLAHGISYVLGAAASARVVVRHYGIGAFWGRPAMPPASVIRYAMPAWGTELLSSVSQRLDVLAVSYWGSPAAVGLYGVVVRIGNAVRSVRRSYDPIVTTLMSDIAASHDPARLRAAFSRATLLVMLTQTPIFAGLALFIDDLLPLFGTGFEGAATPVVVICGFFAMNGAIGLNALIVSGYGRSDLILLDLFFSNVVLAGLLAALVPAHGPLGASIALGLTYLVTNLVQVAQGLRLSKVNPYNLAVARGALGCVAALSAGALVLWIGSDLGHWQSRLLASLAFAVVLIQTGWRPALAQGRDASG